MRARHRRLEAKPGGRQRRAVLAAGSRRAELAHQGGQLVEHDHGDVLDGLGQEHPPLSVVHDVGMELDGRTC